MPEVGHNAVQMDLSDVEHRVGTEEANYGSRAPKVISCAGSWQWITSIRFHWDQEFARETKFGDIIAPQSRAVARDYDHGVAPACVGRIPGSHLIFGGEEWWWYGTHIKPGDRLVQERRFHDYKVTETKFAGQQCFLAATPCTPTSMEVWLQRRARLASVILLPRPKSADGKASKPDRRPATWRISALLPRL